jgi:hypothetical protein
VTAQTARQTQVALEPADEIATALNPGRSSSLPGHSIRSTGTIPLCSRADTQLNSTGAVLHVYERAGGLRYGEVEVGQETVIFDSDFVSGLERNAVRRSYLPQP